MSASVDPGEFVAAFLGEAEDLLRNTSTSLLAVETDLRRGQHSPRAIREAFRAVHTLKGLAAMVGIEPIVALSHAMETVLRAADEAAGRTTPGAADLLLHALREIQRRVDAVAHGRAPAPPPADLLESLEAIQAPSAAPRVEAPTVRLDPALADKLGAAEREQLAGAVASGRRALRVDFTPAPAKADAGLNITSVRERLARVGELVKVVPRAVPASADAPGGLTFAIVLLPTASDAEVADAAGLRPDELVVLAPGGLPADEPSEAPRRAESYLEVDDEGGQRAGVVRVEVARLDAAMERLSALIVNRFRMAGAVERLAASGADVREVQAVLGETTRHLRSMRAAILSARMVPVAELLERIPLLVRGLRRTTAKQVRVEMDVGRAELDKAVAERLFPAIVHLVRNAVDHAIEPVEVRRAAGKPDEGTITITCFERSSRELELTIADDGAGVDRERVAARAGLAAPGDDAALLELLCRPGLSIRAEATTTSGRGMGMDIVRRIAVDELRGQLQLRTRAGEGSAFTLRVPLTISIVDAFSMESAGQRFVVPVAMIEEIVEIDRAHVVQGPSPRRREAVAMIERRGEAMPLLELDLALGRARREGALPTKALVVRRNGEPIAFAVDRMLGQHEVVLRPLEDPLVKTVGVAGATDLGDGQPTLVLDLVSLGAALSPRGSQVPS